MSNGPEEEPKSDQSGIGWLEKWGPLGLPLLTAAGLILVAWYLWRTTNPQAQGAALALVGVVASHLVKETQELVRFWLRRK
jgi:hypothetical protein